MITKKKFPHQFLKKNVRYVFSNYEKNPRPVLMNYKTYNSYK